MPPRIGPRNPLRYRLYLAAHREAQGLSQEQIGNRFGPPVNKGTISRWENCKSGDRRLTWPVVCAYAEALGVMPADLMRPPDSGPSLDALADLLNQAQRKAVVDLIMTMGAHDR